MGDEITLPVSLVSGEAENAAFVIAGIVEDYVHRTPADASDDLYGMPKVFVSEQFAKKHPGICHGLYSEDSVLPAASDRYPGAFLNTAKYNEDRGVFLATVVSLAALLCVIGFAVIISFFVSEKETMRDSVYLMKCSGISSAGCLRIRFSVLGFMSAVSGIAGILLGLLVLLAAVTVLKKLYFPFLSFRFSFVLSVLAPFLTVCAVCFLEFLVNIRLTNRSPMFRKEQTVSQESGLSIKRKFFGKHPVFSKAVKNMYYKSGSFLSLMVCSCLLVFAVIILQLIFGGLREYSDTSMKSDYRVSVSGGSFFSVFSIPYDEEFFSDYEVSLLEECGETEYCFALSKNRIFLTDESLRDKPIPGAADLRRNYQYSKEAASHYEQELADYGYDRDAFLLETRIYGVNESLMRYVCGAVDLPENALIVLYRNRDAGFLFEQGETVPFSAPRMVQGQNRRVDIDTVVAAQKYLDDREDLNELFAGSDVCFIVSECLLKNKAEMGYNNLFVFLKDSGEYRQTEHILNRIYASHADCPVWKIVSAREENDSHRKTVGLLLAISSMVLLLLCVYSFFSVYTVVDSDFSEQKKSWGYLRALSVPKKQAYLYEFFSFITAVFSGGLFAIILFILLLIIAGICGGDSDLTLLTSWNPVWLLIPVTALLSMGAAEILVMVNHYWKKSVNGLITWE